MRYCAAGLTEVYRRVKNVHIALSKFLSKLVLPNPVISFCEKFSNSPGLAFWQLSISVTLASSQ
jgi:hypothetical protein